MVVRGSFTKLSLAGTPIPVNSPARDPGLMSDGVEANARSRAGRGYLGVRAEWVAGTLPGDDD